ncbi:MAG: sensor histidine kinase [Armatimonadota bacterium]
MRVADQDSGGAQALDYDLVQQEKLIVLGELVNGVAHELNNALTGALGFAQILSMRPQLPPAAQRDIAKVRADATRCRDIVHNLLAFARPGGVEKRLIHVNDVVNQTVPLCAYELRGAEIALSTDLAPNLPPIRANFQQMQQVVASLLLNARLRHQDSGGRGKIIIVRSGLTADDQMVQLSVSDNSPAGAPADDLWASGPADSDGQDQHGRRARLAAARHIVEAHMGTLEVGMPEPGLTQFTVTLPSAFSC